LSQNTSFCNYDIFPTQFIFFFLVLVSPLLMMSPGAVPPPPLPPLDATDVKCNVNVKTPISIGSSVQSYF